MKSKQFLYGFVENSGNEENYSFSLREIMEWNTAGSNSRGINMNKRRIVSKKYSEKSVLTDSVPDWLKEFSLFVCPLVMSRVLNQVVEGTTIYVEFLDIATVEHKASKNFQNVLFNSGWLEIFQVFLSFGMGWIPSGDITGSRNVTFLRKTIVLSSAVFITAFLRRACYSLLTVNISFLLCDCFNVSSI